MANTWTSTDPRWLALNPYQRAAAMALMEADGMDPGAARNALGAMVNRSQKSGVDLGEHVSQRIYQPAIEPAQQARLDRIMRSPAFAELTGWAERRTRGEEADPVQGATHFLAPERTMLALEAEEPKKYRSWRQWTGFDPATSQYRGVITRDASHAFLAPEGPHTQSGPATPKATFEGAQAPPAASPAPNMVAAANPGPPKSSTLLGAITDAVFKRGDPQEAAPTPAAPQAPTIPQAPDPRRPVDLARLLSVVNNRQRLGV